MVRRRPGQKEPDQNRPDSRARVKTSPHATRRITASSRGNDVLVPLVCRIRNGRKTGRARSVHGPSGPVRATRVNRYRPLTRYRRDDDPSQGSKPADRDRTRSAPKPCTQGAPSSRNPEPDQAETSRTEKARPNETRTKENTERQTKQKEPEKTSTHTTTKPEKPEDQKKTPKPTNQKTQHHQTTTMRVLHPPRWGTQRTASFVGRVTCLDGFSPDIATNRMGIRVGWAWMAVKNRPCARPAAGP